MSEVLVVADVIDGAVSKPSLELLAVAKRLGEPVAVVFGGAGGDGPDTASLAAAGAEKIYVVEGADFSDYLVAPKAEAVAQIAADKDASHVLVVSTAEGKEVAARVALKLDSGVITDAVDVLADGTATQSVFAGSYTVHGKVTRGVPVIAVKPNAAPVSDGAGAGVVEAVSVTVSDAAKGAKIVSSSPKAASGRPELTEAAVVVAGGRGTGGDFSEVEALADVLGGAVGASRAAVDSGWYPHSFQVGQTGKTVSPQLYVAAGISGAIQHRAGMQTSKTIIAVNKDAEAPIFELVDFGVVGDLKTVLPAATEAIKAKQG